MGIDDPCVLGTLVPVHCPGGDPQQALLIGTIADLLRQLGGTAEIPSEALASGDSFGRAVHFKAEADFVLFSLEPIK